MRETGDLIERLARAGATPVARNIPPGTALAMGMAPTLVAFLLLFGFRRGPEALLHDPLLILRAGFFVALALVATSLIDALGKPGAQVAWWRLAAPFGLLAAAFGFDLSVPGHTSRAMLESYWLCPAAISGLAIAPVATLLLALKSRAPLRPVLAGAIAGLAGGASAATLYAFWCVDTAPTTTVLWYGLALALTTLGGALAGRWLLRW